MFGEIPAYRFFLRHVKGIQFDNVQVSVMKDDLRPAFVLDSVAGVELNNVEAQYAPNVPAFVLKTSTTSPSTNPARFRTRTSQT
jgi:hypothetical protein